MRGKNLKQTNDCDPYCIIKYNNKEGQDIVWETGRKKKTVNPEWVNKKELSINYSKEGPFPPLEVLVKDDNTMKDSFVGNCMVDLTELLNGKGCEWGVNHYFELNTEENKQDSTFAGTMHERTELIEGKPQIYLLAYFVPEGMQDQNVFPIDKEDRVQLGPVGDLLQGVLKVNLVHAKGLLKKDFAWNDSQGLSDPFVIIRYPDNKEEESKVICNTVNPIWNQTFVKQLKLEKGKIKPLNFVIKDKDGDADDLLGYVNVGVEKCFKAPGTWAVNEILQVQGELPKEARELSHTEERPLGELYVQIKWLDEGMVDDNYKAPLLVNLAEELAGQSGLYKGTLRIKLIHCKDCCKVGKKKVSYQVLFKVPGGELVKSREVESEKDPVWNLIYTVGVVTSRGMIQPLSVEVLSKEGMFHGDHVLGTKVVSLDECYRNSCQWTYNKVEKLEGTEQLRKKFNCSAFGEVYFQCMFVGEGEEEKGNNAVLPGLVEDLE